MSKDNELLDLVKNFFRLKTERDLAKRIRMSDSALFKIRKEINALSTKQRINIAVEMGLVKDISEEALMNRMKGILIANAQKKKLLQDDVSTLIGREERAQEAFEEAEQNIISSLVYIKSIKSVLTDDEFERYDQIAEKHLVA
jgi:hypothetical protein